ncbi:Crp/Fnr family transcriptional regulator [Cupriavidus sp. CV2]|uniref:Crp/Fnr family transcriptional regulator n=1 Tax=Cupriavidus ulmosensis TaxID=3065913 RepID=UPI00296A94C8|nr:Crp/Fnr family transcriptional regulator [Cupriavidus sp. CV2]MDW3687356.1 Crp/Fnr family transcriptional regulator [Cupriavidus sp. CV2]
MQKVHAPRAASIPYSERLHASHWFVTLPEPMREQMLAAAGLLSMQPGETLFRRGDPPCGLYFLLDGALTAGSTDARGKESLLTVIEPTTWFGEISLFDGLPCTHDVVAVGRALLLHMPQAALLRLLDAEPRCWRHFALLMAQKVRVVFRSTEAFSLLSASQRLAARLLWIAEGYGGMSVGLTRIGLTQERLASMLALSRQTTNQILKDLESQGIVQLQCGELRILDTERLRLAGNGHC